LSEKSGGISIKTLPLWTVAAGALAFLVVALVLLGRLGDKSRQALDALIAPPELPAGGIVETDDGGPDDAMNPAAPTAAATPGEGLEPSGAPPAPAPAFPNLGVSDVPLFADAAPRVRFAAGGESAGAAGDASSAAGGGNRLSTVVAPAADASVAVDATSVDASVAPERAEPKREEPVHEAGPPQSQLLCGRTVCPVGQVCCNSSCGICTTPGGSCSQQMCGVETMPISAPCGPNTCNVGQVCCNATCGICTPPGGTCDTRQCESAKVPYSVSCGLNTCNVGEVCCNPSCGICAMPGESCNTQPCP
jgi:hypothetical protein